MLYCRTLLSKIYHRRNFQGATIAVNKAVKFSLIDQTSRVKIVPTQHLAQLLAVSKPYSTLKASRPGRIEAPPGFDRFRIAGWWKFKVRSEFKFDQSSNRVRQQPIYSSNLTPLDGRLRGRFVQHVTSARENSTWKALPGFSMSPMKFLVFVCFLCFAP